MDLYSLVWDAMGWRWDISNTSRSGGELVSPHFGAMGTGIATLRIVDKYPTAIPETKETIERSALFPVAEAPFSDRLFRSVRSFHTPTFVLYA